MEKTQRNGWITKKKKKKYIYIYIFWVRRKGCYENYIIYQTANERLTANTFPISVKYDLTY